MNQIAFEFGKIILYLGDPRDWPFAATITGKVTDVAPGVFEMALSTQNMKRIVDRFHGPAKPVVIRGQRFLDELKVKLHNYKLARDSVQEIVSKERYPVEPNGKFIPYAHQTKILGTVISNPFSPCFADCGLGKTGSLGRSFELVIHSQPNFRGRILVSAPLSILHTSWEDDLRKFTSLRSALLWTPLSNKSSLGDERVCVGDRGPKPPQVVATKTKTGTVYRGPQGQIKEEKPNALDGPGWEKLRARWKVGVDLDGNEYPYGEVIARSVHSEKTRENYIREQLARTDVDVYLINHDGVRIYEKILRDYGFEWVVVDESTKIKSPRSKVSHAHVSISWKAKRRNILSGTPNPNGFTDLWQQFYFLDRGLTLEPCLKDFLYEYFRPVKVGFVKTPGGGKEAIRYELKGEREKEALISRVRSVGIYLEQRDCIDLPPRTDTKRVAYMTPEQEVAYDRMETQLVTELANSQGKTVGAEAVNVLAKIMKLRQLTSGFLLNQDEVVHLDTNPKWEIIDDYLEELGDKPLIIACQFREEIEQLIERYKGFGAAAIYGDVSVAERASVIRDFQEHGGRGRHRIVILQPQAAAHGITLTAASHLIFASLDYNFEYYYQTAKRIERLGQASPIFICHVVARYQDGSETIDEDLMDVLTNKSHDRNALFQSSPEQLGEIAEHLTRKLVQRVEKRHGKN